MITTHSEHSCNALFKPQWVMLCLTVLMVMIVLPGCQFAPKQPFAWPWSKPKEKKVPERILPVWTDTVLYQTNQAGVRGFGGRIYFYEKSATDPIEVDGAMAVYVFDADNDELHEQKPLRKFVFTAEQFANHMSRTSIGPSYSIWLPWGEVGGPPLRLSLIARFEGTQGGTVISDPTIKLLPGVPVKKGLAQASDSGSTIQLASHARSAGEDASKGNDTGKAVEHSAKTRRQIETIDLPPSFQRHLLPEERKNYRDEDSAQASENDVVDSALNKLPSQDATVPASVGPITTTVIDYRSRKSNIATQPVGYSGRRGKRDIRTGTWIGRESGSTPFNKDSVDQ